MKNLAGDKDCNVHIKLELSQARIQEISVAEDPVHREVPYTHEGRLGNFTFHRAWYYWIVDGNVPLAAAQEMYADPAGRTDIRVAGHCGCPPPEEWAHWFTPDGREVVSEKELQEIKKYKLDETKYVSREDPNLGVMAAYVTSYHIDSVLGLRIFADTIKKYGLDK
jgi:hypothetical protein